MNNTTTTAPTWIAEAIAASAERESAYLAAERERHYERIARERVALEDSLRRCGIPLEHATLTRDEDNDGGWIAAVDGYQFVRHGHALTRLVRCPACERTVTNGHDVQHPGADVGAMLRDDTPTYHHCPGRPVTDADYDEDGELIDRTPRATQWTPPPTAGEKLLAALAAYIAEQEATP